MQIVINVDNELYEYFSKRRTMHDNGYFSHVGKLIKALRDGIPLSKGHGAIIDIKELEEFWKEHEIGHSAFNGELLYDAGRTSRHDVIWKPLLDVLPTIIEADK